MNLNLSRVRLNLDQELESMLHDHGLIYYGGWRRWWSWRPVRTMGGRTVWLQWCSVRTVYAVLFEEKAIIRKEYADSFDLLKASHD